MNRHLTPKLRLQRGFTLLEIMLVILVIGIMVSQISLPTFGRDAFEQTEEEAKRLAVLINLASEHAVLQNKLMGLSVSEKQYSFLIFEENVWRPLTEAPFLPRELESSDMIFELTLDGLEWQEQNLLNAVEFIDEEAQEELAKLPEEERLAAFPQIFILSSGELSPFDLRVIYDTGFDDPIEFLVRGKFITPVAVYDPKQQLELDE